MKFESPIILSDLVGCSYNVEGNNDVLIHGLGVVYSLSKGDICFAENENILNKLMCSECNAIMSCFDTFFFTEISSKSNANSTL